MLQVDKIDGDTAWVKPTDLPDDNHADYPWPIRIEHLHPAT
ncbi:hypothetical protein [Nocardia tengchongensis]